MAVFMQAESDGLVAARVGYGSGFTSIGLCDDGDRFVARIIVDDGGDRAMQYITAESAEALAAVLLASMEPERREECCRRAAELLSS